MQADLVREIAEAVVRDQLLTNWRLYALLLGLATVGAVAGNWTVTFVRKRAETSALKADMDEILRQLRATTHTAEQIRAAVNHADWAQREWRTVRRIKLEELLGIAYSLGQWLDSQQERWLHGKDIQTDSAPMDRLKIISALYFPELKDEVDTVRSAHLKAFMYVLEVGLEFVRK